MNTWSFDLPIPPSVNATHRHGGGRCWLSTEYRAWRMAAQMTLAGQTSGWVDKPVAPYRVWVEIRGGSGWRADRDMDNTGKAVLDLLVLAGLIEDDSTRFVKRLYFEFEEAEKGRRSEMMVTVEEFRRSIPPKKRQQPITDLI